METLTATPCRVCESRTYVTHVDVKLADETVRVCDACLEAHDGPGKFEGVGHDDETLATALALYSIDLDGGADFTLSDESNGYAAQIGSFVLTVDDRGFVGVETFESDEKAMNWINRLEDDGFGASEDDGWISYERDGIHASLSGKHLGKFERLTRAQAAISVEMRKSGYYPNVFLSGEHGPSVRRINVW